MTFYTIANNVLVMVKFTVLENKQIRARVILSNNELIGEFDFMYIDSNTYSGYDAAIFKQEFKRKGIYTFVINRLQEMYSVKVLPNKLLTPQGKKFWKNRLSKLQPSRTMYVQQ